MVSGVRKKEEGCSVIRGIWKGVQRIKKWGEIFFLFDAMSWVGNLLKGGTAAQNKK